MPLAPPKGFRLVAVVQLDGGSPLTSRVATPKIAILQADSQDVLLVGLVEVIESPSTIKWLVGFRIVGFGLIMLLGIAGIILTNFHQIAIALNHERCSPRSISDRVRFLAQAKQTLNALGLEQIRLAEHQRILQIGLSDPDFKTAIQIRETIVAKIKALGYRFVTLDLTSDSAGPSGLESQSG